MKNLDTIEEKWQKKLTRVAHEAQKLVSPSEVEAEQRAEIERLLKEIDASSQRTVNLNLKLDTLKAQIEQEATLGISELTATAIDDQIKRHNLFTSNEEKIRNELADAQNAYEAKNKAIKKEEETIKDLHVQLERLEKEKQEIEFEIGDLQAKASDPAPKNRSAPRWAAIDKK